MRNFIFPLKDTSIYSQYPNRNTGLDEVLEVGKTNAGHDIVRSLVQFDLPSSVPPAATYDLVLYIANATKLMAQQGVQICQLSGSWVEGTGYFFQEVISTDDGATWTQSSSGSSWPTGSAGGWYRNEISQSLLANPVTDMTIDVTNFVREWISGSVENNGLLLMFPTASENDIGNKGNVKFFSRQTHTVFRPVLVVKWDDAFYATGTLPWPTTSMNVTAIVNEAYRLGEVVQVGVSCREKYPLKTFGQAHTTFTNHRYLPSSSYYSVVDEQSGVVVVPFSNESKISSQNDQNYFALTIDNMYSRRFYRVLIKVDHDGKSEIFDNNTIFTVT